MFNSGLSVFIKELLLLLYIVYGRGNINKQNERIIHTNTLFHLGFVEIISSPHEVVIRGSFYSQSLGKY